MNSRQERFCLEYAASGNATKAAIAAGYSPKTARVQGNRLLTKADIQRRLRELGTDIQTRKIAKIKDVQIFWSEVMQNPENKTADRLKASELIARSQGAFTARGPDLDEEAEGCEDVIIYLPDCGRGKNDK